MEVDSTELFMQSPSYQNVPFTNNSANSAQSGQSMHCTEKNIIRQRKIEEKNRKGRQRSMRTRLRNKAKLALLEANCSHFQKENALLSSFHEQLVKGISSEHILRYLMSLSALLQTRPMSHKLTVDPFSTNATNNKSSRETNLAPRIIAASAATLPLQSYTANSNDECMLHEENINAGARQSLITSGMISAHLLNNMQPSTMSRESNEMQYCTLYESRESQDTKAISDCTAPHTRSEEQLEPLGTDIMEMMHDPLNILNPLASTEELLPFLMAGDSLANETLLEYPRK